jgi:hypothetical protein
MNDAKRRANRTPEQHLRHVEAQISALEKLAPLEAKLAGLRGARREARAQQTHEKVLAGGVVFAAGLGDIDKAELMGWLLLVAQQRTAKPELQPQRREAGLLRFEERRLAADAKRRGGSVVR